MSDETDHAFEADREHVDRMFDADKPGVWTTREGVEMWIRDMTDSHLTNSIRMLERNTKRATEDAIANGYAMLGSLQGEMAQYCVEQELASIEEFGLDTHEAFPVYDELREEAERRGLKL